MNRLLHEPIEILLVEDSPGDVRLLKEALDDARVRNKMHVVGDGIEALKFLRGENEHVGAARPDLILLDLNLPRKDGRQVLSEIKIDDDLRSIPVIVLTTSNAESDVLQCYDLHASCYLVKPASIDRFFDLVGALHNFWLTLVRYPAPQERYAAS